MKKELLNMFHYIISLLIICKMINPKSQIILKFREIGFILLSILHFD